MKVELSQPVVAAIERYLENLPKYPVGSIAALNLVAFVGERVIHIYQEAKEGLKR